MLASEAGTFLLHGVTGSGKTQIYMKAAKNCLTKDKIAIVLVPEIMLTNQIVKRFVDTFGDEVVVFTVSLLSVNGIITGSAYDVRTAILLSVPGPLCLLPLMISV